MSDDTQKPQDPPRDSSRNLRDARLRRALDHAPDAHMKPGSAVRASVLRAAHEAVTATNDVPAAAVARPTMPWWKRLLGGSGRAPWNAAFATVLLAGFITVMWHGEDVPDAQVESAAPQAGAPAQESRKRAAESQSKRMAEAEPAPQREQREDAPAAPPPSSIANAPRAMASAAPAPAPAPTANAYAPPSGPQSWLDAWNNARVLRDAASPGVRKDNAQELALLMRSFMLPIPPGASPPGASADASGLQADRERSSRPAVRIELLRDGEVLGTLELHEDRWRFVSRFSTTPGPRSGVLTDEQFRMLDEELRRLGLVTPP